MEEGATAVEFAMTAPVFFLILFGIIQGGLLLWTQLGLQHGAEMAARCAGVNKILCGNNGAITNFAAQQAYGLNPPASTLDQQRMAAMAANEAAARAKQAADAPPITPMESLSPQDVELAVKMLGDPSLSAPILGLLLINLGLADRDDSAGELAEPFKER